MKCPVDGTTLLMSERHGVEIDYCPTCRGVWLDRGELDKIIEKSVPPMVMNEPGPPSEAQEAAPIREWREPYREPAKQRHDDRGDDRKHPQETGERRYGKRYSKKKRYKSFLEDIFDFD